MILINGGNRVKDLEQYSVKLLPFFIHVTGIIMKKSFKKIKKTIAVFNKIISLFLKI